MATTNASPTSASLRPADLEMFARLGVPLELLEAAGVRRVTDPEARETLGVRHSGDLAGVLYPRRDPESGHERGYRLRRDRPEVDGTTGAPVDKYLSSPGRATFFWAPGSAALLHDISVTVVVVESEKAALAIVAAAARLGRRVLAVGLGGCWGFRGRIGKTVDASGARVDEKGVLPDLDRLTWTDRDAVIFFDANVATNTSVQAAQRALAQELVDRGARVRMHATIPPEDGINGPDDFLARHGDEALWVRVDSAISANTARQVAQPMNESQATRLVRLARATGAELFHDEDEAYVHVRVAGAFETYWLRSRRGRAWLQSLYIDATQKCAGGQAIADALNALEAEALQGPAHRVHVRIAAVDGAIYIDLGDAERRIVEITAGQGWRIVSEAPVRFRRPKGQRPLPVPERGGTIRALRPFVNVSDDEWVLLVSVLLAWLRGRGPYPTLVVNGEQGSAKSTLTTILKALVDPTEAPLRSEPTHVRDLMIAAANAHLLAFDNLSKLPPWFSDAVCRLATSGGFATRTLYENREEELFEAVRPVVVNGIPELATRPDLISRAVLLSLPTISEEGRCDERTLWDDFQRVRPQVLGALYDIVAVALGREASVILPSKPRMADVAIWVVAAEPACPWEPGAFLRVYEGNRLTATEATLDGDPLAELVRTLAPDTWIGTASQLLERLNQVTPELTQRQTGWYRLPRLVSDALRRLAPALRHVGIEVAFLPRTGARRLIRISVPPNGKASSPSPASPASPETDPRDGEP